MRWLIEKGTYGNYESEVGMFEHSIPLIIEALESRGIEYKLMPYVPFDELVILKEEKIKNKALSLFPRRHDVVFYGSLGFATKIRELGWTGVYSDYEKYDCAVYFPIFKENALNYDYLMMPFGEIRNKQEGIFSYFKDEKVFIRPNSVLKEFVGQVVSRFNLDAALETMAFYDQSKPETMVTISSCKTVEKEWRFVACKDEIVTGSLYRDVKQGDKVLTLPCSDEKALEYAQKMAKLYSPEDIWILDICQTEDGDYKVLEMGCFSFAGLYGCDMVKIVDAMSGVIGKKTMDYISDEEWVQNIKIGGKNE